MNIVLAYSPAPRDVREWSLDVAEGCTVAAALAAADVFSAFPELQSAEFPAVGIWGRKVGAEQLVQDGARVEIYRGLRVDPKVARRERFNRQGSKSAGLFAKTRTGAKAGY